MNVQEEEEALFKKKINTTFKMQWNKNETSLQVKQLKNRI